MKWGAGLFVQLEKGESIPCRDVIGVFDFDQMYHNGNDTKTLIREAEKERRLVWLAADLPQSILLVEEPYCTRVYVSGLSGETVRKRLVGG